MTVFTIGYEGLDVQSFVSLLIKHHVRTVVDIRELPTVIAQAWLFQAIPV